MNIDRKFMLLGMAVVLGSLLLFLTCAPPKTEPVKTVSIPDGEIRSGGVGQGLSPGIRLLAQEQGPQPAGASKYRKGWTGDDKFDKLSEYPYMALLFNGWGFGVEYNEIRGHYYMLIDQLEIDPSRLKAGGVCLTCKTPFAPKLMKEMGVNYFKDPYLDVHAKIPAQFQRMGVMCIDCHDNKTMDLKFSRWTLDKALKDMGFDPATATRQEKRSLVCAQCHVTYIVHKDKEMKSIDVFFPWQGSKFGDISIENIIKVLKERPGLSGVEAERHRLQAGLLSGTRNLRFTAETASTGTPMSPAPTATCSIPGGGQQDFQPQRRQPPEAGHGGLPAVPRRVRRLAESPGDRHPGPHHLALMPGRLRHRGGGQAL